MTSDITATNLSVTVGKVPIFDRVTLRCPPGKLTALVGPSGSGKTTLLHCLGLLLPPTAGEITIGARPARGMKARQRRAFWRDQACFILQDHGVIEDEPVWFNVTLRRPAGRRAKVTSEVAQALDTVGLDGRADELAVHLSGGEKQRLALARAVYRDANYLFADEPTASLDAGNRRLVASLLRERAQGGSTVVVATHDEELIAEADHTVVLPRR